MSLFRTALMGLATAAGIFMATAPVAEARSHSRYSRGYRAGYRQAAHNYSRGHYRHHRGRTVVYRTYNRGYYGYNRPYYGRSYFGRPYYNRPGISITFGGSRWR